MEYRKYVLLLFITLSTSLMAQKAIKDESQVPSYKLPDVLTTESGKKVTTTRQWEKRRRPEVLGLFEEYVYGKTPKAKIPVKFSDASIDSHALQGKAVRKQLTIYFGKDKERSMDLLMYLPSGVRGPVPVFLGLNFSGNQVVHADPGILITQRWVRDGNEPAIVHHRATEASRGSQAGDWPVEQILEKGYGLVTAFCGDLQPDKADSFEEGVHSLFFRAGQVKPDSGDWGAIGAWAWGLSRAMDYLETDKDVDARRVAVIGHSRLGKAALWAGAQDPRFALVISNNSGEGGAAITRRKFGETISIINKAFPHWFCDNYKKFNEKEDALPVDFHELIALMAPRPVYIGSASDDWWADPKGEYLSGYYATPVFGLYGFAGLADPEMPKPGGAVPTGRIGYHLRNGGHTMNRYDWEHYLNFADRWLGK